MELDPLLLSRIQFAFVISFHILFPSFTVGLASWIAVLEARALITGRAVFRTLSDFWTRIFAVSFGLGVVSGVVMSWQFGTNWSRWSDIVGNVLGPLINYEVVTAFFLEAAFLGIMLFGRNRVPRGVHFFATCAVALGTLLSSFWILSANSWMHTPAGYEIRDGRFFATDWWAVVFNPSFPYRLSHMVTAMYLTTSLVVAGVSAWYLLKKRHLEEARTGLAMALGLVTVLAPLQIVLGDMHGLNTLEHQPMKIAAMEGHWERQRGAPLHLFAIPDPQSETNRFEISIPHLSALILTHEWNGETPGLKDVPPADRPPVEILFWSFRAMVAIGFAMLALGAAHLVVRWRGRLEDSRWLQRACVALSPAGFVAILCGWITTESGRQPWVVYGLVRTAEGVTPSLTGEAVLISLVAYMATYAIIFTAGTYYLGKLLVAGPKAHEASRDAERPKRPLSRAGISPEPAE